MIGRVGDHWLRRPLLRLRIGAAQQAIRTLS